MITQEPYILGLDLDGTICDYPRGLSDFMHKNYPDPDHYSLVDATGWEFQDMNEYLTVQREAVADDLYANLKVYDGVADTLAELSSMNVHIRIVTDRFFAGRDQQSIISYDTVSWLKYNNIPYDSLCFTGIKDNIGADLYIEDSPKNINDLRSSGYHTMVRDQLYNLKVHGPRLRTWVNSAQTIMDEIVDTEKIGVSINK
jgi:5'(3')-deoxyribonucleotidase